MKQVNSILCMATAVLVALCIASCSKVEPKGPGEDPEKTDTLPTVQAKKFVPIALNSPEKAVALQTDKFAWKFFAVAEKSYKGENLLVSPLSASYALSMTALGANGQSRDEIINALGFENMNIDDVNSFNNKLTQQLGELDNTMKFTSANSLWVNELLESSVLPSFKKSMTDYYNAGLFSLVDSTFQDDVNAWISNKTNGVIQNFLENPIDASAAIVNALYFNAPWGKVKFNKNNTKKKEFTNYNGTKAAVDMMETQDVIYYGNNDIFSNIEIPFGNNAFSMHLILPNEEKTIPECINTIAEKGFEAYLKQSTPANVTLSFPKFQNKNKGDIKDYFQSMGINSIFDSKKADFTNMFATSEYLYVSRIIQGSSISVDEDGSEAACATLVDMNWSSAALYESKSFHVNRPFIYLIREQSTGAILFLGKVEKL